MDSLVERIVEAYKSNDRFSLQSSYEKLKEEILNLRYVSSEELFRMVGKTIYRDLVAESYIPLSAKPENFYALQSQASGNCLYSSMSLVLVGNNSLARKLRILTSLELYLFCDYYVKHPSMVEAFEKGQGVYFSDYKNLLGGLLVSHASLDSGKAALNLLKQEALHILTDKTWSSYICVLALSSAISRPICTYYPDCGAPKLKLLFNQKINPRITPLQVSSHVHILLCFLGNLKPGVEFRHNHFSPLLCGAVSEKGKIVVEPARHFSDKVTKQSKLSFWINRHETLDETEQSCSKTNPLPFVDPTKNISKILPVASTTSKAVNYFLPAISSKSKVLLVSSTDDKVSTINKPINPPCSKGANLPPTSLTMDAMANDVATFMDRAATMQHSGLISLIDNVFTPDESYKFPVKNGRAFKFQWLKQYSWLCYSPSCDGGFCLPCVLFGNRFPHLLKNIKNLVTQPVPAKPCATTLLKNHEKRPVGATKSLHHETVSLFYTYISQNTGKTQPISQLLNQQITHSISENRQKLEPIIDTILLCGRQNIPLRGHRDDSRYQPEIGNYSAGGVGNFIELINYRARANPQFKEILETSAKNATYLSKTAQNEIINCIGEVITEKIISEVKEAKFFSILGDECMDSSGKEQFSLCLRFVDKNFNIREEFLRFLHCTEGLSGEGLSKVLLKCLAEDLNLDVKNCRGQGYDGAGSVAGYRNGLAAHVHHINSKAIYVHCHSHRLNLAICKTCSIQAVENVMSQIKEISFFFNYSETRQMMLERHISQHCPTTTKHKLFNVCATRWVERIKGMDVFDELYIAIVNTLEEMHLNLHKTCNSDTSSKATPFLKVLTSFEFIATFMIAKNIFLMTLQVTELLQSKSNDIMDGVHMIKSLKSRAVMIRNAVDFYHEQWYNEALALTKKLDINEAKPRTVGIRNFRGNVPSDTPSEYFKRNITVPLLDHLNSELKGRFGNTALTSYSGLSVIPEKMISLIQKNVDWKKEFLAFSQFYMDDFPNVQSLPHELELWEIYWKSYEGSLPNNISSTLKAVNFTGFENLKVTLRILGTLPVTSCECERCFSAMKRLKTYARSTMISERLNGLALMHVHQYFVPNVSDVIDKYALKRRRLNFR